MLRVMSIADYIPRRVRLADDNGEPYGRGVGRVQSENPKTPGVFYHCDVEAWICDCPDFAKGKTYRRRQAAGFERTFSGSCKHLRMLAAAWGIIYVLGDAAAKKPKQLR